MIYINLAVSIIIGLGILIYRFYYPKKQINLLYLLLLISVLPVISILRKGTYESGDLTLHAVFLRSFIENLQQGVVIPQWAGNLCGGYGCPSHMHEYILPYYIASFFYFLGFSFINSIKLLLIFSYILSGIGMYLFIKEELGKISAFVAAIFYLFAPYHLMDMHFRASVGEVLSFIFIPLIFLFSKKYFLSGKIRYFILNALSYCFFVLSHALIALCSSILLAIYILIIWNRNKKNLQRLLCTGISLISGLLLSTFYWMPTLFETKYTWLPMSQITTDFKPLDQYLFSPVLYGFLFQGHQGELRLIIGYSHLFVVAILSIMFIKRTVLKQYRLMVIFLLLSFFISFFLLQKISSPIWVHTPLLNTFILPWRLLVPIAFITSFLAGILIKFFSKKSFIIFLCIATIGSTILNWGNRKVVPENQNAYNTHSSLYTEYFDKSKSIYLKRYNERSKIADQLILNRPKVPLETVTGNIYFKQLKRTFTRHEYIVNVKEDSILVDNTYYFPGWKVKVNGKDYPIDFENLDQFGKITFKISKGLYKIDVVFTDTPIRQYAKLLSLATLLFLFFLSIWTYIFNKRRLRSPQF